MKRLSYIGRYGGLITVIAEEKNGTFRLDPISCALYLGYTNQDNQCMIDEMEVERLKESWNQLLPPGYQWICLEETSKYGILTPSLKIIRCVEPGKQEDPSKYVTFEERMAQDGWSHTIEEDAIVWKRS